MSKNNSYPIFLKLDQLQVLIIGGGNVACEKLSFLLKSSPDAKVKLVAPHINPEISELANKAEVQLIVRDFVARDLLETNLLIVATDEPRLNIKIYELAKSRGILANVADTPKFCDFYMGSIVTKGNLKIAISTNGKSPTFAKRIREFLEELIPENINETLEILNRYRKKIRVDFQSKVKELNRVTSSMIDTKP